MQEVFNYIDSNKKELVELVKELVSIPTVNPPGENYAEFVKLLEFHLKKSGLKTRRVYVPKKENRICLLADWHWGGAKTLHINGHYDVVPCTSGWHTEPFKPILKNARIYARGTEDMKGNIACYLMAISALKKYRLKPRCNLQFSFTPDEETGGEAGFGYLVKNNLINADYGISEGYADAYLSYGNKGVVWFKVEIKGKSAHASRPHKGINSFENMTAVAQELMALGKKISKRRTAYVTKEKKDRFSTMVLGGKIWGGEKVNIVPDTSGFTIDRRFLPEENMTAVKSEIYDCINKVKKKNKNLKVKIDVLIEQNAAVCGFHNRLSDTFSKAIKTTLGKTARFAIMAGATDMRFLMQKGIPCLGYSIKGGGRCHADDEYVSIKSLIDATKIFAYVFANFGG